MKYTANPEEPITASRVRFAICLLAIVAAAYCASFLAYCAYDDAPRSWDESYFLYPPTAALRALHTEGYGAAMSTFWNTKCSKPPLCMLGTMPAMLLFGEGSIAYRVDNLVVALGAMWLSYNLMRVRMTPALAATFAGGIVVAPYSILFARTELAEVYLWAATILFLVALLRCDGLRHRGWTAWLGVAFGLGMLSKISFPMVVGPPTLWLLIASLRRDGSGDWRLRLRHALLAGAIGLLIFLPFYAKNWVWIENHLREQFSWVGKEYSIGNPFVLDTLLAYFRTWFDWYGQLWTWLGIAAIAILLLCAAIGRAQRLFDGWPVGALSFGLLVNLVYCYLHPVSDPRFSYGAMLFLQLITAFLLARGLGALSLDRRATATALMLPFLGFLASNSFWPNTGTRCLDVDWPAVGPAYGVLSPPEHGTDLAEQILDLQSVASDQPLHIALAGDHMRLNNETIRLLMLRKGRRGDAFQMAYQGPQPTMSQRFHSMRQSTLWIVLHDSGTSPGSSWASRYSLPALALLRANPAVFEQLPWRGTLPDSVEVLAFRRIHEFTEQTLVQPPPATTGR